MCAIKQKIFYFLSMSLGAGGPESLCAMAGIRRCLTSSKAIALGNDLIIGTEIENIIIE